MTQVVPELTIPDTIDPCWVFTRQPEICPGSIAEWKVLVALPTVYLLCNGCKERWQSFGTITDARRIT